MGAGAQVAQMPYFKNLKKKKKHYSCYIKYAATQLTTTTRHFAAALCRIR